MEGGGNKNQKLTNSIWELQKPSNIGQLGNVVQPQMVLWIVITCLLTPAGGPKGKDRHHCLHIPCGGPYG